MKKVTKILTIVLLIAMIVMSASSVFAADDTKETKGPTSMIKNIEDSSKQEVDMGDLPSTVGTVIAYMRNAAVIIGIVVLVVLGIQYMMGSVEQKAEYKKSFVPLIVGIVLIMAATSIASFVFTIFDF